MDASGLQGLLRPIKRPSGHHKGKTGFMKIAYMLRDPLDLWFLFVYVIGVLVLIFAAMQFLHAVLYKDTKARRDGVRALLLGIALLAPRIVYHQLRLDASDYKKAVTTAYQSTTDAPRDPAGRCRSGRCGYRGAVHCALYTGWCAEHRRTRGAEGRFRADTETEERRRASLYRLYRRRGCTRGGEALPRQPFGGREGPGGR